MSTALAVGAGLGTSACYAGSIALQYTAASSVPPPESGRPRHVAAFVWSTVRQPLWLMGVITDVGGTGLQGLALSQGSLALVQPLLVSSLVLALPLESAMRRERPGPRVITSAVMTAGGLAAFSVLAAPSDDGVVSFGDALIMVGALGGVVLVLLLAAGRRPGVRRAALLGIAAGLLFAGTGALLKITAGDLVDHGIFGTIADWPLWPLAVCGIGAMVLEQTAFNAGPLSASLPGITVADPIASVVLSVGLFGDDVGVGPAQQVGLSLGLLVMSLGAIDLARDAGRRRPPAA